MLLAKGNFKIKEKYKGELLQSLPHLQCHVDDVLLVVGGDLDVRVGEADPEKAAGSLKWRTSFGQLNEMAVLDKTDTTSAY